MNRADCLELARHAACGKREQDYGTPERNFRAIAELWSAYLESKIEPYDVAAMMILLKIARVKSSPAHEDSWVDIAGYAACGVEIATG